MSLLRRLEPAALVELLMSKFANRFQHRESRLALLTIGDPHKRLVHQRGQTFESVEWDIVQIDNGFGGLKCPASAKDRQLGEQLSLRFGQEVIAPSDCAAQCALPFGECW